MRICTYSASVKKVYRQDFFESYSDKMTIFSYFLKFLTMVILFDSSMVLFEGHLHSSSETMRQRKGSLTINFTAKCRLGCEWWGKKWAERENGAMLRRKHAQSFARGTKLAWHATHKHLNSLDLFLISSSHVSLFFICSFIVKKYGSYLPP